MTKPLLAVASATIAETSRSVAAAPSGTVTVMVPVRRNVPGPAMVLGAATARVVTVPPLRIVKPAPAAVAGLATGVAAGTGEELLVAELMGGDPELVEDGFIRLVRAFALLADGPDETLGEDSLQ